MENVFLYKKEIFRREYERGIFEKKSCGGIKIRKMEHFVKSCLMINC